jgi:voltage-gated potassium channel
VIVAGMGRVGRQAALELHDAGAPFVVIDPSESAVQFGLERGYPGLVGDAARDDVLEHAGIRRARGLIVTTGDDATSVYVVLSARVLNPELYIVARATDEAGVTKVLRAGANRAVSPYAIGGHRLAHLMLSPAVVDFFETAFRRGQDALAIEDLLLPADSPCVGRSLDALDIRRATGATVLAILRDGNPVASPPGDFALAAADRLLALGTGDQLRRLEKMITAGRAA